MVKKFNVIPIKKTVKVKNFTIKPKVVERDPFSEKLRSSKIKDAHPLEVRSNKEINMGGTLKPGPIKQTWDIKKTP